MNLSGIIKKIAKDERGQALVEFALIFTMLVILLFGIAEFGRGWYYANVLSNGARAGARYASLQPKQYRLKQRVQRLHVGCDDLGKYRTEQTFREHIRFQDRTVAASQ